MPDRTGTGTATPTADDVHAGTAVYTSEWLGQYDAVVLERVCGRIWLCDAEEMVRLYDRNIGASHLDLGPGTGYFLDRCRQAVPEPRLTLVDLNPVVLGEAAARLQRFGPAVHERDVLAPFTLDGAAYESVGLNFLLHCLPGGMRHKSRVFDHALAHVAPGGRIFGSTVLSAGVTHTAEARRLLETLNERRTFDNADDSLDGLNAALSERFSDYRVTTRGSVAFFEISISGGVNT